MNFEKLLKDKKIQVLKEKSLPDFEKCESDLKVAKNNFSNKDFDWAMNIAHNSVLLASREIMFYLGFRPIGKEHHKNVFGFLRELKFDKDLVDYFDKIRVKRNKVVYGELEEINEGLAEETIEKAKDFVHKIRTFVQEIRTDEQTREDENEEGREKSKDNKEKDKDE